MPEWITGWTYRKKITIDELKVDADLVDFPVLVKLTSANFDFTKALSTGYDIRFTSSDGTTLLKYERERHDSVNSLAEYWVKIPSVSGTVNTEFYIYYGNSGATDGADPTAVWDADYKGVWHKKDITTSTIADSTANANNGTKKVANEPIEADGKIGKAQNYDGYNDYVEIPHSDEFPRKDVTVEFWLYQKKYGIPASYITKRIINGNGLMFFMHTGNKLYFDWGDGTSNRRWDTEYIPPLNEWVHLTITRDGKGRYLYVNGDFHSSTTDPGGPIPETNTSKIMLMRDSTAFQHYANGIIDEVRISKVARSAAWLKAT